MYPVSYRFDEKVLFGGNWWRYWQPDALRDSTMGIFDAGMGTAFDSHH